MTLLNSLAQFLGFRAYRTNLLITYFHHEDSHEIPTSNEVLSFTREYGFFAGRITRRAIKLFHGFRDFPFTVEIRPDQMRLLSFHHDMFFSSSWEPEEYAMMSPRLQISDKDVRDVIEDLDLKDPVQLDLVIKVYSSAKIKDWKLRAHFRNSADAIRFKFMMT